MAKRKAITKKVRFEVFKRDSFKCQYCGASAPDVILEVDHIQPVAKRGTGDIMNLITACKDCNAGKSDRLLDDSTAVSKQKAQADQLNERREQLKMMMDWKRGLISIHEEAINEVCKFWSELTGTTVTDLGKVTIRKLVKKYGLQEMLEVIEAAAESYKDREQAFKKLNGIAIVRHRTKTDPALDIVNRCMHVVKKHRGFIDYEGINRTVRDRIADGVPEKVLIKAAYDSRSCSDFLYTIENMEGR